MDAKDVIILIMLFALVASDWSQIAYNRAATQLMFEHGRELDLLRKAIDASNPRGPAAEPEE